MIDDKDVERVVARLDLKGIASIDADRLKKALINGECAACSGAGWFVLNDIGGGRHPAQPGESLGGAEQCEACEGWGF